MNPAFREEVSILAEMNQQHADSARIDFYFYCQASLMLGSGFSCSETVEHGFEAYKRGDFSNALAGGASTAQYNLGVMHYYGIVPQDFREAVKWYRKSAKQGHSTAQYNLGVSYDNIWYRNTIWVV